MSSGKGFFTRAQIRRILTKMGDKMEPGESDEIISYIPFDEVSDKICHSYDRFCNFIYEFDFSPSYNLDNYRTVFDQFIVIGCNRFIYCSVIGCNRVIYCAVIGCNRLIYCAVIGCNRLIYCAVIGCNRLIYCAVIGCNILFYRGMRLALTC